MEQNQNGLQNTDGEDTIQSGKKSNLPIVALLLNVIPYLLFLASRDIIFLILIGIFPIAGFIVGITALCLGKKRIGERGLVISQIAVAWPLVFIATYITFGAVGALTFRM